MPERVTEKIVFKPLRKRLPDTRQSLTHKFSISGHEGYITVGMYEDGRPGEVFITMAKEGSTIGGLMDCFGTAISMSLQYGVPLEVYVKKFSHSRFDPMGFTKNPDIRSAKSIVDYIFRWLGITFLNYPSDQDHAPVPEEGDPLPTKPIPMLPLPKDVQDRESSKPGEVQGSASRKPDERAAKEPEAPKKEASDDVPPKAERPRETISLAPERREALQTPFVAQNDRRKSFTESYDEIYDEEKMRDTADLPLRRKTGGHAAGKAPHTLGAVEAEMEGMVVTQEALREANRGYQDDAPLCPVCGSVTYRNGSCYLCPVCATSTGCS